MDSTKTVKSSVANGIAPSPRLIRSGSPVEPGDPSDISVTIARPPNPDGPSRGVPLILSGTLEVSPDIRDLLVTVKIIHNTSGYIYPDEAAGIAGGGWGLDRKIHTVGDHKLIVNASGKGRGGITKQDEANIQINIPDNVPPILEIRKPADSDGKEIELSEYGSRIPFEGSIKEYLGVSTLNLSATFGTEPTPLIDPIISPEGIYTAKFDIDGRKLGEHIIKFTCMDRSNNYAEIIRKFITIDKTLPTVNIIEPEEGKKILGTPPETKVSIRGTAKDIQTLVSNVEWSLDEGPYQQAQKDSENWETWSASVSIKSYGKHIITIRSLDGAKNNGVPKSCMFEIMRPYKPKNVIDLVGRRAYLEELSDFTSRRIDTPSGSLTMESIRSIFFQSIAIDKLVDPLSYWADIQINRIRLCIEVLWQYAAANIPKFDFSAAKSLYLQATYETILNRIGTSYEEIRLIRGEEDVNKRNAVAEKIGIDSNHLDELLLDSSHLNEPQIETLFGFIDTNRKTWDVIPKPQFLKWQLEHLRKLWIQEDHPGDTKTEIPMPIIDPDNVDEADLAHPFVGNPPFDVWGVRSAFVRNEFNDLKVQREQQPDAHSGLGKIINSTIIRPINYSSCKNKNTLIEFLDCLYEDLKQGKDIGPALTAMHLTMKSFSYILRIKRLAKDTGTVTDMEWTDIYNILVQVKKSQKYIAWREEERAKDIALTPDHFKISAVTRVIISPWRSSQQMRQSWEDTLRVRTEHELSIIEMLDSNIQLAEESTLPLLRNAIVSAIFANQKSSETIDKLIDRLTDELLIDVGGGSSQKTTRIMHAIEVLQELFFRLRTSRFETNHPASSWSLKKDAKYDEEDFDNEWKWMGSYVAWRSVMLVFFYPDTILLPSLQPEEEQSEAFKTLIEKSRSGKPRLTPEIARDLAYDFFKKVREDYDNGLPELPTDEYLIDKDMTDEKLTKKREICKSAYENSQSSELKFRYVKEVFFFVPLHLAMQLQKSGEYIASLDWYQTVYSYNLAFDKRKIYYGLELEKNTPFDIFISDGWLREPLNPHKIASGRPNPYTRFTLMSLVQCLLEFADTEFSRGTNESIVKARSLYMAAHELVMLPELQPPIGVPGDTVLPNPILDALSRYIDNQISKLRQGRTIAGMKRQAETYVPSPIGITNPAAGANSSGGTRQLLVPETPTLRPTPYRYSVLIERSKQLATLAQQIESSYLYSIEKHDAEYYNLKKAGYDLELVEANKNLQNLRLIEAQHEVDLSQKQIERVLFQQKTYDEWSHAPPNYWEDQMMKSYEEAATKRNLINYIDMGVQLAQLGLSVAMSSGTPWQAGAAVIAATAAVGGIVGKAVSTEELIGIEARGQKASVMASYELRKQEWEFQKSLADKDLATSEQQKKLAEDRKSIVNQESIITDTQMLHAKSMVEFLSKEKFTNYDLYEWMSGVLAGVYNFFLQQATAMAQLAQNQLAFERNERPPNFILADYWESPSDATSNPADSTNKDRRGLTGSARLLRDIHQLDQHAFDTNKRKLNLIQTFSLSQLAPLEFRQFRETGVIPFSISMKLFDLCFPGHYLRLIKRIRTSVVALVPPVQGIRASLVSSGVSRVVVDTGGGIFQTVEVWRSPELVALTSPTNATGIFDLDFQSEMLLPFESMGVDTSWELQMPKAANQFDYNTIADVLFTIEYTALNSFEYRQQVVKAMDTKISSNYTFSLRDTFPDQWYELQNPEQFDEENRMTLKFNVGREDFPPNIQNLQIEHILVYFSQSNDNDKTVTSEITARLSQGRPTTDKDKATSVDGIISTRRGNWITLKGEIVSPIGEWEMSLRSEDPVVNNEILSKLRNGMIQDIVFVITYKGNLPSWPA